MRPDLSDQGYRSLLQQRTEETALSSGSRSRHEERIIQGDERPAVVRAPAKPPATAAPGASLQDILAVVEKALQSAGTTGLTGLEIFERLPPGGCTLAQLRDSLLALAIPAQAEDGTRRYAAWLQNLNAEALPHRHSWPRLCTLHCLCYLCSGSWSRCNT